MSLFNLFMGAALLGLFFGLIGFAFVENRLTWPTIAAWFACSAVVGLVVGRILWLKFTREVGEKTDKK